ncbi:MAG: hypothetical protein HQ596_06670 [Candidatus Saganbacteria bacterium]|nr:hypothetical protein [Candidatus Saganbacteria bacterium]
MSKQRNKKRSGFALIAAVFIVLAVTFLAVTLSTLLSSDSVNAVKNYHSLASFYIASSGSEYYIKELADDSDWSSPVTLEAISFSGGFFSITTTDEAADQITFISTGLITVGATSYSRKIQVTVARTSGGGSIPEDYVIYAGEGAGGAETDIGDNASITGNILVNADLDIGSNVNIDGDVYSTGDVDIGNNTTITGTYEGDITLPNNLPTLESAHYDSEIAVAAAAVSGDLAFPNNTTHTLSGTTYVNGSVTFGLDCIINIAGEATIVSTGTVRVRNNVNIGDNLSVITGGGIDIDNNIDIGGSGVWYSSQAFDVGNNFDIGGPGSGEGTVFFTAGDIGLGNFPGDIDFGNNGEFYGLIFTRGDFAQTGNNFHFEGSMVAGYLASVGNNATLSTHPGLVDFDSLIGIGGGAGADTFEIIEWEEIY